MIQRGRHQKQSEHLRSRLLLEGEQNINSLNAGSEPHAALFTSTCFTFSLSLFPPNLKPSCTSCHVRRPATEQRTAENFLKVCDAHLVRRGPREIRGSVNKVKLSCLPQQPKGL